MQRILLAVGGAAVLSAVATLLLQIAIARGLPADQIVVVTSVATLVLAAASTFLAYRAFNRSNETAMELERLTRSMDAAIREVSARGDRDSAVLGDLSATVSRRLEALSSQIGPAGDADSEKGIDQTRASGRRGKAGKSDAGDVLLRPGVEVALRRVASGGDAEISLQPIIAAGRGAAGGFEVHFHIQPEEGKPVDIRRLPGDLADFDMARFERLSVASATEAARLRPGDISDKTPLHVAISRALLEDGLEFAAVLDIFRLHPSLARSIVLSLPADLAETDDLRAPIEILSGLHVRFAAEDWSGTQKALDTIKKAGCECIKLSADRLLDRAKAGKGSASGDKLIGMAASAGLEIIATDVASDEDAVSLIDKGIDLMTGERLSPPRRLKNDGHGAIRS